MTVKELMEILSEIRADATVYLIQEYFQQDTLKELSAPLRGAGPLDNHSIYLCGPSVDEIADEYC